MTEKNFIIENHVTYISTKNTSKTCSSTAFLSFVTNTIFIPIDISYGFILPFSNDSLY